MYKFKQLKWEPHDEFNGVYAEPNGLKHSYSIRILDDARIQLSILGADFDYTSDSLPQFYNTVTQAQQEATKHYIQFLEQFIK
jgi:hypothetical protein